MRVQVVHHEDDLLGVGVVPVHQLLDDLGEVQARAPVADGGVPPAAQRLADHKQVADPAALVLIILPGWPARLRRAGRADLGDLNDALAAEVAELFGEAPRIALVGEPAVILVVGVNGTGKTTTIGKLAYRLRDHGHSVVIAAADTFRAAAEEQLGIWAERAGAEFVEGERGADPASVAYDAIERARRDGRDVVVVDTAGRLHTQTNLMDELAKVRRVITSRVDGAPHETLLVVDATTGQNAVQQARLFGEAVGVTGVALTKLDGSAKGGVAIPIAYELGLPVKLIGVGETLEDLRPFDAQDFARALVG